MTINYDKEPQVTTILNDKEKVSKQLLRFFNESKVIYSCGDRNLPSLVFEVDEYRNLLVGNKKNDVKIKFITDITKDNVEYCKKLQKIVDELRHIDGIKANFSLSENEYIASSSRLQGLTPSDQPIEQIVYSNTSYIVEQQRYVFESFWNRATPAEYRINEIEGKISPGITEIMQSPAKTVELFINLINSAKEEVLLLLPTVNAFLREDRIGIINSLIRLSLDCNVSVKILTPINDIIDKILSGKHIDKKNTNFIVQSYENQTATEPSPATTASSIGNNIKINTITILIVDKKRSLVIEKKDDMQPNLVDAIGLATYSTSIPTVISYVNIFYNLLNQLKLYEQLKIHGKMQQEFINIASHELRTPTQVILAYSELLEQHPQKTTEMIQAIKRNAERLEKLVEDILDVTRIESKKLVLHKEKFNLADLLSSIVNENKKSVEGFKVINNNIKLTYEKTNNDDLHVIEGDVQRITQVILNLLSNAIKSIEEKGGGNISINIAQIKIKKKDSNSKDIEGKEVVVSIKDTGIGINKDILARLFTKFATNSSKGTGLGLFICKSIIEAHGGRIWAQNNEEDEGATFSFSLPFYN